MAGSRLILKFPRQVELHQLVISDRIDARNIQIVAAGAQTVLDLVGITVADCANDGICNTIGKCRVKALKVGSTFKKVGVNEVHV